MTIESRMRRREVKVKNESIASIKEKLKNIEDPADPQIAIWQLDTRKGVQTALNQWRKRLEKKHQLEEKYHAMQLFENNAREKGYHAIAGIDEVGRGPLAGPVVTAAVILPEDVELLGVNDSKQLTHDQREILFDEIQAKALSIGIGMMSEEVIDEVNIYEATKLAMQQAIDNSSIQPEYLLIDAMQLNNSIPQEKIIKGDARSVSIAAASIIAKVTRDRLMVDYSKKYPGYGFEHNAGYGTKEHLEGLEKFGITPIHRKTFAPVKKYL